MDAMSCTPVPCEHFLHHFTTTLDVFSLSLTGFHLNLAINNVIACMDSSLKPTGALQMSKRGMVYLGACKRLKIGFMRMVMMKPRRLT